MVFQTDRDFQLAKGFLIISAPFCFLVWYDYGSRPGSRLVLHNPRSHLEIWVGPAAARSKQSTPYPLGSRPPLPTGRPKVPVIRIPLQVYSAETLNTCDIGPPGITNNPESNISVAIEDSQDGKLGTSSDKASV
ncbi:hypothetical protein FRC12_015570 [Ceratobasidium sp. 428]|nr:hypothetical protein FRC12_015570 [Ceratobasidium sp. 428]